MSSWFGGGLSQITGQISNFTKEVLEEGTGEVDDPVTQLKITRKHLVELDSHSQAQRIELERLKSENTELQEKLESSELQINAISNEYREIVDKKDTEIKELKLNQNDLFGPSKISPSTSPPSSGMSHSSSAPSLYGGFHGDDQDFDDVISTQYEINRLRSENTRLEAECAHWKRQQAQQNRTSGSSQEDTDQIHRLEAQLKEIRQQYDDELDNHQRELATLHDVHSQKVSTLKRKHKDELSKHQQLLLEQDVQLSPTSNITSPGGDLTTEKLNDKLQHLEKVHEKLTIDLELTHAADREKARQLQQLQEQLREAKEEGVKLRKEYDELHQEKTDLMEQLDSVVSERRQMSEQVSDLSQKVREKEETLLELQERRASGAGLDSFLSSTPIKPGKHHHHHHHPNQSPSQHWSGTQGSDSTFDNDLTGPSQQDQNWESVVKGLKEQVSEYEGQIEQFELVKSDWQMEKEALEDVLLKLREQLREKEEALNIAQAQKGLLELDRQDRRMSMGQDIEANVNEITQQVELLTQGNSDLEKERDSLVTEKEQLQKLLESQKQTLSLAEEQMKDTTAQSISSLETELAAKEETIATLKDKVTEKESVLGELEAKVQSTQKMLDEMTASLKSSETDRNQNYELLQQEKAKVASLNNELATLQEKLRDGNITDEHQQSQDSTQTTKEENDQMRERISQLTEELEDVRSRLNVELDQLKDVNQSVTEEKDGLLESLEELDRQHETALEHIIDARNTLSQENESLKARVSDLTKQLEELGTAASNSEQTANMKEVEDRQELVRLKKEREKVAVALNDLHMSNQELTETKAKLKEEKKVLNNKYHEVMKEKKQACDKMEMMEEGLKAEQKHRQEETGKLRKQVNELKDELEAYNQSQHNAAQYLGQLKELKKETASLKMSHQQEVEQLNSKIKVLREKKEDLENQMLEVEEKFVVEESSQQALGTDKEKQESTEEKDVNSAKENEDASSENSEEIKSKLQKLTDLEQQVCTLQNSIDTKDSKLRESANDLKQLSETVSKYEEQISELTQTVVERDSALTLLKNPARESGSLENTDSSVSNRERLKEAEVVVNGDDGIQNGDNNGDNFHSNVAIEEMDKLRKLISQKDTVISQLNDNNSSLLKLLEERSQAVYGNNALLDIHRLENEVRGLHMEKDQMMSVLNEKSRECSSLKAEVHRLMNVVSAEKMALSKLQQDNNDLLKVKDTNVEQPNEDMTMEGIKKLSQIIRDKDMEIEALNQKNQTLLQVLQQSSDNGPELSSLMQERDNLLKQITVFQTDRENIISALNTKHQESVAYHGEVQRLGGVIATEQQKQDRLQNDFSSLKQQYEDKQHALVKMQNEMLNYKRKFSEIDTKHRELKKRQESMQGGGNNGAHSVTSSSSCSPDTEAAAASAAEETASSVADAVHQTLAASSYIQEIDDLKAVIQSHEVAFSEKDKLLEQKTNSLQEKSTALLEKDIVINEKDKLLSELNVKLHRTDEALRSKESEVNGFKKQSENLTFQIQGLQTELADLQQERNQLFERHSILQQEIGTLKEANNRLTLTLNDKEFEISASKEKSNSLSKLFEERGVGEKEEMDRIMKESELVQRQAQMMKQERDQGLLALQQQQTENQHLRQEIQRLQEKNQKLVKELDRLRGHLLSIEENYTQDALAAEEREKELRNKLAAAEERAMSSSTAIQTANQQSLQQVDSLQTQLHTVAEQRDSALLQLSSAQETANQYATSLQNLQMVLEQFQMERETQQNMEMERYQKEAGAYRNENHQLREQIRELQAQASETSDALEAAQRLSEQLDRKEEMIAALREEVQLRESELKKAEDDICSLSVSREARVDKELVKNLILGYFHTPASKRKEALQLIGRVLDFSKADMEQLGAETGSRGWLGGFFKKSSPTPPTTPVHRNPNKSFSELFVSFLERESSPQLDLRLPTERMVSESQQRHAHHNQTSHHAPRVSAANDRSAAFNPFTAPMATTMPLHINTNNKRSSQIDSHPLMKPITPSLPMFAPATAGGQGSNLLVASSHNPEVYSQNLPTNSGAILRDVLQQ